MESAVRDACVVFRDDVEVRFDGDSVSLTHPTTSFLLRPVGKGIRTALKRLAAGPTTVPDLVDGLVPGEQVQIGRFLDRAGHLIARSVCLGGRELVRIEPTARDADYRPVAVPAGTPARLSRFAFCRSRADVFVLESSTATFRVQLVDRSARELVAALGTARTAAELAGDDLPLDHVRELLGHLAGAGLLDLGDAAGRFAADDDETLRQWEFHDLLFHSRIRSGRYDDVFGAVYPHRGRIEQRPAVRTPPDGPAVELYRPTFEQVMTHDPALTAAIEGRRSIREYGDEPLTADQLGEFLYRVGRVRAHYTPGPDSAPGTAGGDEVVSRPYPSGGSAYELELYVTVRRCRGLDAGIYYYDPVAHRLVLVNDDAADRASLLNVAGRATGLDARPDVLITLTSRFQRLSWKYRAIAYATTLRHTGVLYQTMYLVATAMGLAACGLGNGDAGMSARVLGLDYLQESSVGDFILGSKPAGDPFAGRVPAGWTTVNGAEWAAEAGALLP